MRLTAGIAVVVTAWIVSMPSVVLAHHNASHGGPSPDACSNGGRPPFCAQSVPEIDAASGLAAVAAVLAGLALAREWRLRKS